jgi:NAD(P)-dependent dehydrogenase (short-subunit alcohol dehydrogenase family)
MKTAIVTGGAHGIGKGIALRLLKDGFIVIVLDYNPEYLSVLEKETAEESKQLITFTCDVGSPEEVEDTIKKIETLYGQVDCLVNNAGISVFEPIDTMTIETWDYIISVNLSSIFYLVKACLPLFTEKSAILNIASTRALMSEPNGEAYGAGKGGIVALTHALSVSLGPKTRVNCISPGWIEVNDYENLSEADHLQHPVGRVGKVEDIAEAASFLLSEKAEFITGQNLVVDGGMTKKMIYI